MKVRYTAAMTISVWGIAIVTACATVCGGLFALRYDDKRHLILGFSAGAVLGVAFFDLLPEAFRLGGVGATTTIAVGFLAYLLLDRMMGIHVHSDDHHHHAEKLHRGVLRASSLCIHSFFDGVAIGIAFHIAPAIGAVVAAAVVAHDFSDGINTVSAVLKTGISKKSAFRWLVADAAAPILGIALTAYAAIPDGVLGTILALFCGFFLYIGASDLVPESYHAHPNKWTTVATILGAGAIFWVIALVG